MAALGGKSPFSPFSDTGSQAESLTDAHVSTVLGFLKQHRTTLQSRLQEWPVELDPALRPIGLHVNPEERLESLDLIRTDNELFNKVMCVFTVLCDEIADLRRTAETRYFPAISMFGRAYEDQEAKGGELEVELGRFLPLLQDVSNFTERCRAIIANAVHQLTSLYNQSERIFQTVYKQVALQPVFDSLASLLYVLITLDALIIDNNTLQSAWDRYKIMMHIVDKDPSSYNADAPKLRRAERLLMKLGATLMAGNSFRMCVDQDFEIPLEPNGPPIGVRRNPILRQEFTMRIASGLDIHVGAMDSESEVNEPLYVVGYFGLYVLLRQLTPPTVAPDQNLFKKLWRLQDGLLTVPLFGRAAWMPGDFLKRHADIPSLQLKPREPSEYRATKVQAIDEMLETRAEVMNRMVSVWLVQLEADWPCRATNSAETTVELLRERGRLMLDGLSIAVRCRRIARTFLTMHLTTETPIAKKSIGALSQCLEIMKVIEWALELRNADIAAGTSHLLRSFANDLLSLYRPYKAKMESSRRTDEVRRDMFAALQLIEIALYGSESLSPTRRLALRFAMSVVLMKGSPVSSTESSAVRLLTLLDMFADFSHNLQTATDCSFLMWNQELLPAMLQAICKRGEQANRLRHLTAAFSDGYNLARSAAIVVNDVLTELNLRSDTPAQPYAEVYKKHLLSCIEDNLIKRIATAVENDLRVHVHAAHSVGVNEYNPKASTTPGLTVFMRLKPFRVIDTLLDVRRMVETLLETTFYHLTTVASHDWKTYSEMTALASDKYGLTFTDNHLPMGAVDQGLDVLKIMRKINVFIRRYNYNLNQQLFVERKPDRGSKHLNVVTIDSISASVRTHGTGMISTTVNFAYQFLKEKFLMFSQFLFDEYIKSYLSKERRNYDRTKAELNNEYPYDRASEFTKEIRKLGLFENKDSYLDRFRQLITEIGAVLGFVRMVRAAGMHACAEAVKFIPNLQRLPSFEGMAGSGTEGDGANLPGPTVQAAINLDNVIRNLTSNIKEGADYLKVLVEIFSRNMSGDNYSHLKNFYMIVPALTLSFVNSIRIGKGRMDKPVKSREAYFTDDGFAIGIAYILTILGQNVQFESLRWWESVRKYNAVQIAQQQEADRRSGRPKNVDREVVEYDTRRIQAEQHEFELLYFSFSGARIFFQQSTRLTE